MPEAFLKKKTEICPMSASEFHDIEFNTTLAEYMCSQFCGIGCRERHVVLPNGGDVTILCTETGAGASFG
jgi:hypothetical protein